MYQVTVTLYVMNERVRIQAEMWEIDDLGHSSSLGDTPPQIYLGASRGHDWFGDALETLRKWAEMSLF